MRPGDTTPLVAGVTMHLMSGDAYSSLVLGTRGQRVKVVTLVDRGAPLTRRVSTTPAATGAGPGATVVVAHGDCLWTIARRALGAQASNEAVWNETMAIYDLNAKRIGTGDPNLLFPGTRPGGAGPVRRDRTRTEPTRRGQPVTVRVPCMPAARCPGTLQK
ncbi:MAG: hypothetical protein ABSH51_28610 [Solirubrobacteraceae bacterium]